MRKLLLVGGLALLTACGTHGPYQNFVPAPEESGDCYIRLYTPKYKGDTEPPPISYGPYCNRTKESTPPSVGAK